MPSLKPSKPSLPRLLRKVTGDEFPARDIVATLDMENNLVRVRQDWWDAQPAIVQNQIWKMTEAYLIESDFRSINSYKSQLNYAQF